MPFKKRVKLGTTTWTRTPDWIEVGGNYWTASTMAFVRLTLAGEMDLLSKMYPWKV